MGSGKTSIGKKFARRQNLEFLDLDEFIEETFQKTISELFSEKGEKSFRLIEQKALFEVSLKNDSVISLGGGTPCFMNNIEFIKKTGVSIYLKLSESILIGRLRLKKEKRPLISKLSDIEISSFVHEKLKDREEYYTQADFILENNHPDAKKIAELLEID
jgi:shikimate kinase